MSHTTMNTPSQKPSTTDVTESDRVFLNMLDDIPHVQPGDKCILGTNGAWEIDTYRYARTLLGSVRRTLQSSLYPGYSRTDLVVALQDLITRLHQTIERCRLVLDTPYVIGGRRVFGITSGHCQQYIDFGLRLYTYTQKIQTNLGHLRTTYASDAQVVTSLQHYTSQLLEDQSILSLVLHRLTSDRRGLRKQYTKGDQRPSLWTTCVTPHGRQKRSGIHGPT
jgi:hypothetical protein